MPKILNLTIDEKAERYSKLRKGAVGLTIEERAVKWDEYVIIRSKYCMEYASRNKEKLDIVRKAHYESNKVEYNKKACIRIKNKRIIDRLKKKDSSVPITHSIEL